MQRDSQQLGVVLVQMLTIGTKQQNIQHAVRLIRDAYQRYQPRLIVLPEYFNTLSDKESLEEAAEMIPNGETSKILSDLAKELNIYLVGGSIPERDSQDKQILYNTTVVYDNNGNLVAKYRKIHLLDLELEQEMTLENRRIQLRESEIFRGGNKLAIFDIEGIKIGLGIGYDISFNELAGLYRKEGVDLLIYPAAVPASLGRWQWEQLNRSRAIDNEIYVMGVSQARNDLRNDLRNDYDQYGRSMLVDPRGRVLARAGEDEELVYANLNLGDLKHSRDALLLNKHRRNDIYDLVYKQN